MGVNLPTKATVHCRIGSALVSGASADTNIAIAGIKTTDQLICVWESAAASALFTDQTAASAILTDGNIQCTNDTSSDLLLVLWMSQENS